MMSLINKRIVIILSVLVIVILASSCKKYLSQEPENSITRSDFFKTKADATAAVIGCYDALQSCSEKFLTWGEFRGDLIIATANNDITYPYYQYFDNIKPASDWSVVYRLIGRSNIVIESVPAIPSIDPKFTEDESKAIVGEALFLRSLAYFYLVRTFKEVPLVTQASSSDAINFLVPKSSSFSILAQIEKDLVTAEATVPLNYDKSIDTRGRITKAAVNALLTDVYLWDAKYQLAADASKKVLDNTALYALVAGANWFTNFSQKNTSESIFEIQYDYKLNENNNLRNVATNFNMNNVLLNYFNGETDVTRGLNNTYTIGSNPFWKYNGLNTTNITRSTNDPNFILYRLADVMLMRAEALVHIADFNQRQEGCDLLNKVRLRAGLIDYNFIDGNTPTSLLMDFIIKERAMELAMEGKRWFDLVRVATNDQNPDFLINKVVQSRLVGDRALIKSRIIDVRSWYLPIYKDELAKNPNLVQNSYYK